MDISLDLIYVPSEDIVARVIEDELIIVPLTAGIGDADDNLYSLNETGKSIWLHLDGKKTLRGITAELVEEFSETQTVIENDVLGLIEELAQRKMVVVIQK